MSTLFLVDGSHCLYRACHAHGELTYERGGEVLRSGGVYGFLQMVRGAHSRLADGEAVVVVAWEDPQRRERGVRYMMYPEYKQKRRAEEEVDFGVVELRKFVKEQGELLRDLLPKIGIPQAYAPGWEGDDVLGTLSSSYPDDQVIIFSGDKDMLSCVAENVSVMRPLEKGYQTVDLEVWATEHKVRPDQWAEVLALMGDDSDNIVGVNGIGPKTAEKLVGAHGSLEGVIRAAAAGQIKRFSPAITEIADKLRLNLKLTTLNRQVELIWTPPAKSEEEVEQRFREMKFHSYTSWSDLQSIMAMGVDAW